MTDSSPTPPNRQDPPLDPADDSGEPAFDWMKPRSAEQRPSAAVDRTPVAAAGTTVAAATPAATTPVAATPVAAASERRQAGTRADRKAAEAAVEPSQRGQGSHFSEPLPTSALQLRPPEEEVQRRNAEREHAANAKPVAPRVMQVLLAVCFPVILLVLAVRAIASPLFLWVEYNRPGFPGDGYGFSTDDRLTYGSYAVDYLSNWAGPRYLGELVHRGGDKLFRDGEVSHMADVKLVILSTFGAGALLILLSLIAVIYLRRRTAGGVRRGLFAGSIISLVVVTSLGVLGALGWEQFFTEFHSVFFASGTWTFSLQDTLIRLFPAQFWVDGGIVIAALVLIASLLTLILTWPTRKRRGLPKRGAKSAEPDAAAVAHTASGDGVPGSPANLAGEANPGSPANLAGEANPGGEADKPKRSLFRRNKTDQADAPADTAPADTLDTPARGSSSTV
ncbi:TIGR01906 family membrane protein [Pseudarthrobacter sp. PH31-O2]|uniref:TIGR01906 family membrane protein n=1 Tax=Pseudarthrobacter sp. PH31-O2 TaxID=3046206 RepID=UPI0032D964D6